MTMRVESVKGLGTVFLTVLLVGCATTLEEQPADRAPADAGPQTVSTASGLQMAFTPKGSLETLSVRGRRLPLLAGPLFAVEQVLVPDGRKTGWHAIHGKLSGDGRALHVVGGSEELALQVRADITGGPFVQIAGELQDLTGRDRAARLRFTLPVDLVGWRWESTAFRSALIEKGQCYPSQARDLLYLYRVGPSKDRDPTESGLPVNRLPFTVVSHGQTALAMAYPVHEPRAFLVQAVADGRQSGDGLSMTFTLGLTPLTDKSPSRATFRLVLYPVDAAWGVRPAAEHYARFFPELYASSNRRHGNYTVLPTYGGDSERRWPEDPQNFGYRFAENDFQWTDGQMRPEAARHAEDLGLIVFHWRGPWYWFHAVPNGISRPARRFEAGVDSIGRGTKTGEIPVVVPSEARRLAPPCGREARADRGVGPEWQGGQRDEEGTR
jgi:hypothetical protein